MNLLNKFGKDKMQSSGKHFIPFPLKSLINSIIQEHECLTLSYETKTILELRLFCVKILRFCQIYVMFYRHHSITLINM